MDGNLVLNVATLQERGDGREHMEDLIWTEHIPGTETTPDISIFLLADGNGYYPGRQKAEDIICPIITGNLKQLINDKPDVFIQDPNYFVKMALLNANQVLGGFKIGNEEKYAGYRVSIAICTVIQSNVFITYTGNTRVYVLRKGCIKQLTHDQTVAQYLVDTGMISEDLYYTHPDSYKLTSSIGDVANPDIQMTKKKLMPEDIYIMTTDGIHMVITEQGLLELTLLSGNCKDAASALIATACDELHSEDDMACILFHVATPIPANPS